METIIRVNFERSETGVYHAKSEDMTGLYVMAHSYCEMTDAIPKAIRRLLTAMGRSGDDVQRMVSARNSQLKFLIRQS